jgi:hypothetical protein
VERFQAARGEPVERKRHGIFKTNVTMKSYYQLASHLLWSALRGAL